MCGPSRAVLTGIVACSLLMLISELLGNLLLPLHEALTGCCRCPGGLAVAVLFPLGVALGFVLFVSMSLPLFSAICERYGTMP